MPKCPNPGCNVECTDLGTHWWRSNDCDYPIPTDRQQEMFKGLLMGDGCIARHGEIDKNPRFTIQMVTESFLEWVHSEMYPLTTGVKLTDSNTASERTKTLQATGFATGECQDVYTLESRGLPWLENLADWYSSGKKRFPDNLELTPMVARMWYVSDGGLMHNHTSQLQIASVNESSRQQFLLDLLNDVGFDGYATKNKIVLNQSDRDQFLDWMGDAPPGFEYKWRVNA